MSAHANGNGTVFLNETANHSDLCCVLLARLGFSHKAITEQTGLKSYQISYRLSRLGIRIEDYRNGKSELATRVIKAAHIDAAGIATQIRKLLKA